LSDFAYQIAVPANREVVRLLETFIALALITAFGGKLLSEAASEWIAGRWKAAGITKHDLQRALRNAYDDTLSAIDFAFHERRLLALILRRRLYRGISSDFNKEFLARLSSERNLSEDELNNLIRGSVKYCKILSAAVDQILPSDEILGVNIEDLLLTGRTLGGIKDIQKLNKSTTSSLMARVRDVKGVPELFFEFLEYRDLLTWSIIFFFCETIKSDERIRGILTHSELQRIWEEQNQQHREQAVRLQSALQSQLAGFQQCLGPIRDKLTEFVIVD